MKVILENELERYAWDVMMNAQRKWIRNQGSSLVDYLDWHFEELHKEETDNAVKKEVEQRLRDKFGDEFFVSEDEYVKAELEGYALDKLADEERQGLEQNFREDYVQVRRLIDDERELLTEYVRLILRDLYLNYFIKLEKMTVIYNGEVIQGADNGQELEA